LIRFVSGDATCRASPANALSRYGVGRGARLSLETSAMLRAFADAVRSRMFSVGAALLRLNGAS
jgi:hypothetical protein